MKLLTFRFFFPRPSGPPGMNRMPGPPGPNMMGPSAPRPGMPPVPPTSQVHLFILFGIFYTDICGCPSQPS